jgi:hypothetical protein
VIDDEQFARLRRDADRYRQAAEVTLEQLEWCIGYFQRTRKSRIASSIRGNVSTIRKMLTT